MQCCESADAETHKHNIVLGGVGEGRNRNPGSADSGEAKKSSCDREVNQRAQTKQKLTRKFSGTTTSISAYGSTGRSTFTFVRAVAEQKVTETHAPPIAAQCKNLLHNSVLLQKVSEASATILEVDAWLRHPLRVAVDLQASADHGSVCAPRGTSGRIC